MPLVLKLYAKRGEPTYFHASSLWYLTLSDFQADSR